MITRFEIPSHAGSGSIRRMASQCSTPWTLVHTRDTDFEWVPYGLERMLQVASDNGSVMIYSDHFNDGAPAPVIDCQEGGILRDDFDFGGVQIFRTDALRQAASQMTEDYLYAGLYDLRLKASRLGPVTHVPEFLYYETDGDKRSSGERLFDYVNPRARAVQLEMEAACTDHLRAVGALLRPDEYKDIDLSGGEFAYEASVVIPCRNRVRTISDAIRSALGQKTDFPYNVIVVDDNSTDGTVEKILEFASDPRLVYIPQPPVWHGIGGNWNAALHHPLCGRFALQLDSDDVYSGPDTVQRFVDAFRSQNCAMVIGTYRITDFNLRELPPGVIDHREWTPDNGRNNALRINGLGAPRGFFTPLLRSINFPPTKYGEDYAVALRISREWRIGRIYDVMYCCRRWEDNSDAALSVEKTNENNLYKDRIRSWELQARKRR